MEFDEKSMTLEIKEKEPKIHDENSKIKYAFEKIVENNKTSTSVKTLDAKERVTEIMRMAGGNNISEASRINAEQLLIMAEKIKNDLKRDL